jgi:hypothetical protein
VTTPDLTSLPLGSWVVAELPDDTAFTPSYQRQVLAVWVGVGTARGITAKGPAYIRAQRWYPDLRRVGAVREVLRFVRAATSIDLTIHGVPVGRPVFRVTMDPLRGPMLFPLPN